ncbi:MAG: ribosomal protein S18-alanine N-acetyltransferase [Chloroflexota bacterium]
MKLAVVPMELEDIGQVLEVDRESYSMPWPASAYRREVLHNRNARYLVLREVSNTVAAQPRDDGASRLRLPLPFFRWPSRSEQRHGEGRILGYAGMWLMVDEAHITTIAVRGEWRGRGLGELLLASLMESGAEVGARRVTLEVRVSNEAAQALYRKYGFAQTGRRPRYYSDDNEDAYIMTTEDIQSAEYRERFERLVQMLHDRLVKSREVLVAAPAFPELFESEPAAEGE